MKHRLLRLPLYTLGAGFLLRFLTLVLAGLILQGTNEWTLEMGALLTYLLAAFSLLLLVLIGLRLRRFYDRRDFFWSATLMVAYAVVSLVIEQLFQSFGSYSMISHYMYLPLEIFVNLASALGRLLNAESLWIQVGVSIFAPYLFLLFSPPRSTPVTYDTAL